ncbi:hypothetical protein N8844_07565 [Planktomarina temperata]|nr:hypothetical protein [Planktomarina temperata]
MLNTDIQVRKWKAQKGGDRTSCGHSLYLRGWDDGTKVLEFRTKSGWVTLGSYPSLSLAEARAMVPVCKQLLKDNVATTEGLKALVTRVNTAHDLSLLAARNINDDKVSKMHTFDKAYRDWYQRQLRSGIWTHRASISRPLTFYETYAEKHIGSLRLDEIRRSTIKAFMQPLFMSNPALASKLVGYINKVFEEAMDNELIDANPTPQKFAKPNREPSHAPSLQFEQLPELWSWLKLQEFSDTMKAAMRLTIVTAHRAAVISNMKKTHYDQESGVWAIPRKPKGSTEVGLMKSRRAFDARLPIGLRHELERLITASQDCDYVFSIDGKRPINAESLRRNFKRFGPITTHGFRNTFKTWCLHNDVDDFLADRYCDHAFKGLDKNYRRDDLFEQRAELAERYFDFIRGAS